MTSPHFGRFGRSDSPAEVRKGRVERRRDRIRTGIQQARSGRHLVPTWLMATILGLVLAGWVALLITK